MKSKLLLLIFLGILSIDSAYADINYLLSLRIDRSIGTGIEYNSYAVQVNALPNYYTYRSDQSVPSKLWFMCGYSGSISKIFKHENYRSAIDWLIGDHFMEDDFDLGYQSIGYLLIKDFDNVNVFIGSYLRFIYDSGDETSYKYFSINPWISVGMQLRL
jgi:hypothetical protein